jgi:thymidylate kinase
MNSRLILIEGLLGTGKSTLSQFIHLQIKRHGIKSCWYCETQNPHPIIGDSSHHSTLDLALAQLISQWQALVAKALQTKEIIVMDAAFLQYIILTMLTWNIDEMTIMNCIQKMIPVIQPLQPTLLFLNRDHISETLKGLSQSRGPQWMEKSIERFNQTLFARQRNLCGINGFMDFMQNYKNIAEAAFDNSPFSKLKLNISKEEWAQYRRQILHFLDISPVDEPKYSYSQLKKFLGTYFYTFQGLLMDYFSIQWQDSSMIVSGLPFLISPQHSHRLIINEENSFYVEAFPYEFSFEEEDGYVACMKIPHQSQKIFNVDPLFPKVNEKEVAK